MMEKIIATKYGSKMGVPAIFDKSFSLALQKLNGDEGASSLISKTRIVVLVWIQEKKQPIWIPRRTILLSGN